MAHEVQALTSKSGGCLTDGSTCLSWKDEFHDLYKKVKGTLELDSQLEESFPEEPQRDDKVTTKKAWKIWRYPIPIRDFTTIYMRGDPSKTIMIRVDLHELAREVLMECWQ